MLDSPQHNSAAPTACPGPPPFGESPGMAWLPPGEPMLSTSAATSRRGVAALVDSMGEGRGIPIQYLGGDLHVTRFQTAHRGARHAHARGDSDLGHPGCLAHTNQGG